jgi:hypothetical protein
VQSRDDEGDIAFIGGSNSIAHQHGETVRSEQMPQIHLRPDNWNVLVTYASHHLPDSSHNVHAASQGLHNVEVELNRLLTVPLQNRGPNSSLQIRFNGLQTNLDNMRNTLNGINSAFYN